MGKKGISSEFFTTPGGLILVMLIATLALVFATSGQSGIQNMWREVCYKYADMQLPFCGSFNATTADYQTSENSVKALACALNRVSLGNEIPKCEYDFQLGTTEPFFKGTANVVARNIELITGAEVLAGSDIRSITINMLTSFRTCEEACEHRLCGDPGDIPGCEVVKAESSSIGTKCDCTVIIPNTPVVDCYADGIRADCVILGPGEQYSSLGTVIGEGKNEEKQREDARSKCADLWNDMKNKDGPYILVNERDNTKCTVYNFNLPQDIESKSSAREMIEILGDPDFLVYYEVFPQGEDHWNDYSKWYQDIGQLTFWGICLTTIIGKPLKEAVFKPLSKLLMESKSTGSIISWFGKKLGLKFADDVLVLGGGLSKKNFARSMATNKANSVVVNAYKGNVDNYLADAVKYGGVKKSGTEYVKLRKIFERVSKQINYASDTEILGKYLSKETQESLLRTLVTSPEARAAATKALSLGLFDSSISYYVWRHQSEFGKFFEIEPKSLVIQNSMNIDELRTSILLDNMQIEKSAVIVDPTKQNVVELGKTVVLDNPGIWDGIKPLVLVSPCRTKLTVKNSENKVMCAFYSYDYRDGMSMCISPDDLNFWKKLSLQIQRGIEIQDCGTIPHNLDDEALEFYKVDGKEIPMIEYELIESGLKGLEILGEKTTIETDYVCCELTWDEGALGELPDYQWAEREACRIDYWSDYCKRAEDEQMNRLWDKLAKVEIIEESDSRYSSCLGSKPQETINVQEINDPINGITLYYDYDSQTLKYYKEDSEIRPIVPTDGLLTTNGMCRSLHLYPDLGLVKLAPNPEFFLDSEEDFDENILMCNARAVKLKNYGRRDSTMLSYRLYWEMDENDNKDVTPVSLMINYEQYPSQVSAFDVQYTTITLNDDDSDGRFDSLGHYVWYYTTDHLSSPPTTFPKTEWESVFAFDGSGNMESYAFGGIAKPEDEDPYAEGACLIDAIAVIPDMTDIKGEYNYCYRVGGSGAKGILLTTASFAASGLTKFTKKWGWWGYLASVVIDCGLAAGQSFIKSSWPGTQN